MRPALLDLDVAALTERLDGPGRARMVFRSLSHGRDPFSDPELPVGLKVRLGAAARPFAVTERLRTRAQDGTTKMLLRLPEREDAVECVLIPETSRTTLCVSSQVGCARGCSFCLTATMGLKSNLHKREILAQVHHALSVQRALGLPKLRNIVFMGMGEPLDNWHEVRGALEILIDGRGFGFGARHITVSTVASTPKRVLALADCPVRIAWSLHAARDPVRRALVTTQRHAVIELRDAFVAVFQSRKDPLFVEMTLMDGVNDAESDAEAAAALFATFPNEVRFNLLPLNPTDRGLFPSPPHRVAAFEARLRDAGYFAKVRTARGQDARAACGQLAVLRAES